MHPGWFCGWWRSYHAVYIKASGCGSLSAAPPDTKRSPSEVVVVPAGGEPDVEKLDDAQDQRRGAISAEQQAEQPSQLLDVKFLLLNCARAVPTNEVDDHLVLETLERCDLDAHLLLELVAKAQPCHYVLPGAARREGLQYVLLHRAALRAAPLRAELLRSRVHAHTVARDARSCVLVLLTLLALSAS